MKFNREPVYRRSIYPWYDSELACIVTIVLASVVLFFGTVGISVALKTYEYHLYVWVPTLITILSGIVILSNMVRLTKKIFRRFSENVSRIDMGDK